MKIKKSKNKKMGFTLIELLAVIVILGLLMAIAIPSVTKYITQSRKKTVSTTVGNYISALTNQVNDMEYTFTAANTVYAVPIECIALERGGTNPFGKWHQANNAYWAYVLVQYDDVTSSYTYGFTFKDSAGYGLYPTTSEKLSENGSQIQTGLSLTRPTTGSITNITAKNNWLGFDVDNDTSLVVLEATSEGGTGNGTTTCTLCQKGDNYTQVEEEKNNGGGTPLPPEETGIGTASIYVTNGRYTINIEFQKGTTWGEFMNNQDMFYYNGYQFYRFGITSVGVSTYAIYLNGTGVHMYDQIVDGANYVTGTEHAGGTID